MPEHGGTPSPTTLGATTVALHLYVDDCDAMVERMTAEGAELLMEPMDMFWGERFARVRDPFGHEWGLATRTHDTSADEIQASATAMFEAMDESYVILDGSPCVCRHGCVLSSSSVKAIVLTGSRIVSFDRFDVLSAECPARPSVLAPILIMGGHRAKLGVRWCLTSGENNHGGSACVTRGDDTRHFE